MFVTGGRPEMSTRSSMPYEEERKAAPTSAKPAIVKPREARGKLASSARKPTRYSAHASRNGLNEL